MAVVLIHGIRSEEGDNNMSALYPYMKRLIKDEEVWMFEYGFMNFWEARWSNKFVAQRLAVQSKDGDVWITHSNGAAIAYLAVTKYGAKPRLIININPALDRARTAPVEGVLTIHSEGDRAVWLSQWIPGHIWGDQGKVGYKGKEKNTLNVNASRVGGKMGYKEHCELFDSQRIESWAYYIANTIEFRARAILNDRQ